MSDAKATGTKSRVRPRTLEIIQELLAEQKRTAETGSVDRGFRTRLAVRYGVSRGRITNIARTVGLTEA